MASSSSTSTLSLVPSSFLENIAFNTDYPRSMEAIQELAERYSNDTSYPLEILPILVKCLKKVLPDLKAQETEIKKLKKKLNEDSHLANFEKLVSIRGERYDLFYTSIVLLLECLQEPPQIITKWTEKLIISLPSPIHSFSGSPSPFSLSPEAAHILKKYLQLEDKSSSPTSQQRCLLILAGCSFDRVGCAGDGWAFYYFRQYFFKYEGESLYQFHARLSRAPSRHSMLAQINLGLNYIRDQNYKEAEHVLQGDIINHCRCDHVHLGLVRAHLCLEQNKIHEAFSNFSQASRFLGDDPELDEAVHKETYDILIKLNSTPFSASLKIEYFDLLACFANDPIKKLEYTQLAYDTAFSEEIVDFEVRNQAKQKYIGHLTEMAESKSASVTPTTWYKKAFELGHIESGLKLIDHYSKNFPENKEEIEKTVTDILTILNRDPARESPSALERIIQNKNLFPGAKETTRECTIPSLIDGLFHTISLYSLLGRISENNQFFRLFTTRFLSSCPQRQILAAYFNKDTDVLYKQLPDFSAAAFLFDTLGLDKNAHRRRAVLCGIILFELAKQKDHPFSRLYKRVIDILTKKSKATFTPFKGKRGAKRFATWILANKDKAASHSIAELLTSEIATEKAKKNKDRVTELEKIKRLYDRVMSKSLTCTVHTASSSSSTSSSGSTSSTHSAPSSSSTGSTHRAVSRRTAETSPGVELLEIRSRVDDGKEGKEEKKESKPATPAANNLPAEINPAPTVGTLRI